MVGAEVMTSRALSVNSFVCPLVMMTMTSLTPLLLPLPRRPRMAARRTRASGTASGDNDVRLAKGQQRWLPP
jgi:hypothetical protein